MTGSDQVCMIGSMHEIGTYSDVTIWEIKTLCLEYRQNYVQIYIGICRQGAGLGFRKSTPFYMGLPVL